MKNKKNEELFYEVYHYAARVTKMAALIQNDQEITEEQYKEWAQLGVKNINDIKNWMKRVYLHIKEYQHEKAEGGVADQK